MPRLQLPIRCRQEEQFLKYPDLKMIAITETGSDIVDLKECHERGIIVSTICGYAVNPDERMSKIFLPLNAFMATMDINSVD